MSEPRTREHEPTYITCRCGARWTAVGDSHPAWLRQTRRNPTPGVRGAAHRLRASNRASRGCFLVGMWRGPEDPDAATRWAR